MDIRYATPEDDIRDLWRECFGQEDEGYFRRDYRPERTLVVADDSGTTAAMLHIVPQTLIVPAHPSSGQPGREVPVAYIMGIGTSPEFRGQGFAGDLVEQVLFELHLRNIPLALLLPCGARMAEFYARYGFRQLGVMPRASALSGEEQTVHEITEADAAELNTLYERLCGSTAHLRRDTEQWRHIAEEYELRRCDNRYRVLYQGAVLEDSAAPLGQTEVSSCVKVIEAEAVRSLLEDLGYTVDNTEYYDTFSPWNGLSRNGCPAVPEEMLNGVPFYVNLMYNERAE